MKREENTELFKEILNGVKLIGEKTYENFIKSFGVSSSDFGKTTLLECMIYSLFIFDYLLHSKKLSHEFRKKYVIGILQQFTKGFKNEKDNDNLIDDINNRFNSYTVIPNKEGDKWPVAVLNILLFNLQNSKNKNQIQEVYPFEISDATTAFLGTVTFMENQPENFKRAVDLVKNLFKKKKGCYIATMVYKDYESVEVRTLRKYRDNVLDKTNLGKLFVKIYYVFSPKFVKIFNNSKIVNKVIKTVLDQIVKNLK